ncbi:DedA family protein [Ectobacillus funiculus]|uniref:DedA family protein n=1 Tax=Ectobacillus funiculus TaxID=137993 RepID=UPI003978DBF0
MEQQLMGLLMHYGYLGLILALAGGVVGLPVPDEVLLTFVGYNVSRGHMTYFVALASGYAGAFLGITISYILGLKLGLPALRKWGPKLRITEDNIQRTHTLFDKYGPVVLVVGYYLPGVRHLSAYFAGISSMSVRKFCFYAYTGALLWVSLFITLGMKLGDHWSYVESCIHQYGIYLFFFSVFSIPLMIMYLQSTKKSKPSDRV